jgi:hypothetical protein
MLINNDLINVNHHHLRHITFLLHHRIFAHSDQEVLALHTLRWAQLEGTEICRKCLIDLPFTTTVISASSFLARHLSFTRFGEGLKVALGATHWRI